MRVISARVENSELKRLDQLASEEHKGRSAVARELIQQGWQFRMLKQYRDGKLSLGGLAKSLDLTVGDTIDMLAELGIESPIEYEDYLKGFEVLAKK